MKKIYFFALLIVAVACSHEEPGAAQFAQRNCTITDFDRIEASEGLEVTIRKGNIFSVLVNGDRRDVGNLQVSKTGTTLTITPGVVKTNPGRLVITITMPTLLSVSFADAVSGTITGFSDASGRIDVSLTGKSMAKFEIATAKFHVAMSGSSQAILTHGHAAELYGRILGGSQIVALDFPIEVATISLDGASAANLNVASRLTVNAKGSSQLVLGSSPAVESNLKDDSNLSRQMQNWLHRPPGPYKGKRHGLIAKAVKRITLQIDEGPAQRIAVDREVAQFIVSHFCRRTGRIIVDIRTFYHKIGATNDTVQGHWERVLSAELTGINFPDHISCLAGRNVNVNQIFQRTGDLPGH